ncbi:hypothetical protein Mgra_00000205 [Meloidogyne graminicola]|uniref:Uncharacterized protein n=1 Tax=Meloidogyne graminicola TaxID=189291 RepID=A0A8T0A2N4_9BILA|nr:hypothetical protein Mgra_00000205 [Meloidogyne graminicola]
MFFINNKNLKINFSVPFYSIFKYFIKFLKLLSSKNNKTFWLIFLYLFIVLCTQDTEGFLLSHRNLFVPFVSSKSASSSSSSSPKIISKIINQIKENKKQKGNN